MKSNLEILLGEWGAWKRGANQTGLGYPAASVYAKDRVDHGGWGSSFVPNVPMGDDDLRRLDRCIAQLHPDWRACVVAHYVLLGYAEDKARRLGINRREFYRRIETAHLQLSHNMGGKYTVGWEPRFTVTAAGVDKVCGQN